MSGIKRGELTDARLIGMDGAEGAYLLREADLFRWKPRSVGKPRIETEEK